MGGEWGESWGRVGGDDGHSKSNFATSFIWRIGLLGFTFQHVILSTFVSPYMGGGRPRRFVALGALKAKKPQIACVGL